MVADDARDARRHRARDDGAARSARACARERRVVFETHSTSVDNELGIATGWNQGELSETGRVQARQLGERRRDDGIAVVFTSDLHRAVETAAIAFAGSSLPVVRDPRLRECNYGALNGMPRAQLDAERHLRVDDAVPRRRELAAGGRAGRRASWASCRSRTTGSASS